MRIINPNIKITRDHGVFHLKKDVWLMPTLHPAAVLRNMSKKSEVEQDFYNLKNKITELNLT